MAALAEEEFVEKLACRVVSRLGTVPKSQAKGEQRYVRDVEAARYLGVSAATLRSWRSKRSPSGPPVTRMGKMVMYSVKELEEYMEMRTIARR
jgi:predicted DNA-binding transcriptional regulator AlpA